MDVTKLTKNLQGFIKESEGNLEKILEEPVKEYLEATLTSNDWFSAIMHNAGSEADEAVRFGYSLEKTSREDLSAMVTKKLASSIVSTTLIPSLLPTPLLTSMNQAILSCMRELDEEK